MEQFLPLVTLPLHIHEEICSNLSFEEAMELLIILKKKQITCPISIFDPITGRSLILPGVNPSTIQTYHVVKKYGLDKFIYESIIRGYDLALQTALDLKLFGVNDFVENVPALAWAVSLTSLRHGKTDRVVDFLIRNGANVNDLSYDFTPLVIAARDKNLSAVVQLINAGADINLKTFGDTPLIWAIRANRKEVVEILLKYPQLDLEIISDHDHLSAYDTAIQRERYDIADLIAKEMTRRSHPGI